MGISGQWVIRRHGDTSAEPYVGPGSHDEIYAIVDSWNREVEAIHRAQRNCPETFFYMERVIERVTVSAAAAIAGVDVSTIRTWARYGAVDAVKASGSWMIERESLRRRVALSRRTVSAQLAAFADADAAQAKAVELLEVGALVPLDAYRCLAVAANGADEYLVDTLAGSCTCKGHTYTGRCYHLLAATMLESRAAHIALAA
jgi:hypothetical protein